MFLNTSALLAFKPLILEQFVAIKPKIYQLNEKNLQRIFPNNNLYTIQTSLERTLNSKILRHMYFVINLQVLFIMYTSSLKCVFKEKNIETEILLRDRSHFTVKMALKMVLKSGICEQFLGHIVNCNN